MTIKLNIPVIVIISLKLVNNMSIYMYEVRSGYVYKHIILLTSRDNDSESDIMIRITLDIMMI